MPKGPTTTQYMYIGGIVADQLSKMAATIIGSSKNPSKSSSPEPAGDPGVTLTYFTARSNLVIKAFLWEKSENSGFFRNYCSL